MQDWWGYFGGVVGVGVGLIRLAGDLLQEEAEEDEVDGEEGVVRGLGRW